MYDDPTSYALDGVSSAVTVLSSFLSLIITIIVLIALWKMFKKAGQPGWGCIVPIYNLICFGRIAFGNGALGLLALIPGANLIFLMVVYFCIAKKFGKGTGFAIFSALLPGVAVLILGFGNAEYEG